MNNSTLLPEIDGPLNSPSFMAYSILLAVVTLVAGLMIGFTIVALLKATPVAGTVRLLLVNLLFAALLMAVALMLAVSTSVALVNVSSSVPQQRYLCRVYLWAFGAGTAARLWSLATFSLSILAIVRFGKKTLGMWWCAAVVTAALWLIPCVWCSIACFCMYLRHSLLTMLPASLTLRVLSSLRAITLLLPHRLSLQVSHR